MKFTVVASRRLEGRMYRSVKANADLLKLRGKLLVIQGTIEYLEGRNKFLGISMSPSFGQILGFLDAEEKPCSRKTLAKCLKKLTAMGAIVLLPQQAEMELEK